MLDLLWEADPRGLPRPTDERAPSCSWAAVDGSVIWSQQPRGQALKEFLQLYPEDAPVINIQDWGVYGSLPTKGRLAPVEILNIDDIFHPQHLRRSRLKAKAADLSDIVIGESNFVPDYNLEGEGTFQISNGATVHLLRAARIPCVIATTDPVLVLTKVEFERYSRYRRVGIAHLPLN